MSYVIKAREFTSVWKDLAHKIIIFITLIASRNILIATHQLIYFENLP